LILYISLTLLIAGFYGYLQFTLARKWDTIAVDESANQNLPFVSVIVPVRNEATNIEACLRSLSHQDFSQRDYEVIVVDNHSTDETLRLAKELCSRLPNLSVIDLSQTHSMEHAFKKEALRAGIGRASGDYILTTDGDCKVPYKWVSTMVNALHEPGVEFVTGPIMIESGMDFLSQYQCIDLAGMMVATGGGIASGKLILANGANMGFSKERFKELGGYQDHIATASGDDVFLIQQLYEEDPGSVRFIKNREAVVRTGFEHSTSHLLRQRKRWASKAGKLVHSSSRTIAVLVFINSFCLLAHLPLIAIFGQVAFYLFITHLVLKILADQQIIGRGLTFFSIPSTTPVIFAAHLCNPLLNVLVGLSTLISKKYIWKDRTAN